MNIKTFSNKRDVYKVVSEILVTSFAYPNLSLLTKPCPLPNPFFEHLDGPSQGNISTQSSEYVFSSPSIIIKEDDSYQMPSNAVHMEESNLPKILISTPLKKSISTLYFQVLLLS